jgi:hypothetical protein
MAMKTTQAWGWLAAGVLALGLNGFYHDGGAVWAHRVVDGVVERVAGRSGALVNLVSEGVDQFMGKANLAATLNETASCRLATAMAQVQTKMARAQNGMAHFQAMSARQEADRARVETQRVRVRVTAGTFHPVAFQAMKIRVVCPRVRVSVPRPPMVKIPAPAVQVEMLGPV